MAKKKSCDTNKGKPNPPEETKVEKEDVQVDANVEDASEETPEETKVEKEDVHKQEIPKDVLHILSLYPDMKYLYVGKGGGIYRNGTPESIRRNSVLYENPYYNNKKTER